MSMEATCIKRDVELAFGQIELVFENGMFLILRFEVEND